MIHQNKHIKFKLNKININSLQQLIKLKFSMNSQLSSTTKINKTIICTKKPKKLSQITFHKSR